MPNIAASDDLRCPITAAGLDDFYTGMYAIVRDNGYGCSPVVEFNCVGAGLGGVPLPLIYGATVYNANRRDFADGLIDS